MHVRELIKVFSSLPIGHPIVRGWDELYGSIGEGSDAVVLKTNKSSDVFAWEESFIKAGLSVEVRQAEGIWYLRVTWPEPLIETPSVVMLKPETEGTLDVPLPVDLSHILDASRYIATPVKDGYAYPSPTKHPLYPERK